MFVWIIHNPRELSTAKSNLMRKSDQMEESSNYESLNQRSLNSIIIISCGMLFHWASYSSFTRGQIRTGDLTTRGNTLYVFFCNKSIFAITTEINTLYSSRFKLVLGISTITKAPKLFPNRKSSPFPSSRPYLSANTHFSKFF